MIYLNDREENIIAKFITVAENYNHEEMLLRWKDGTMAYGFYESYIEDDNDADLDSEEYEEFRSFIFKATKVIGNPPIYVTEHKYFLLNYHNFPDEILVDGKKIN